jgi:serine/threonine protein kinase
LNTVGKVFPDDRDFEEEKAKHIMIEKHVDPNHEFSVPIYETCRVKEFQPSNTAFKCGVLSSAARRTPRQPLSQIIYQYAGKDLQRIITTKRGSERQFKIMLKKMRPILIGLQKIHDYGYVHQDIKCGNLLWDHRAKKMVMIDFGILTPINNIYNESNQYVLSYDYPYYPPEFKLFVFNKTYLQFYVKFLRNFKFHIEIAKESVDYLQILASHFKVDISGSLNDAFKHKCFDPSKVDLYSFGMVCLALYIWAGLHKVQEPTHPKVAALITGLLHFDSEKRLSFEEAIAAFDACFTYRMKGDDKKRP